LEADSIWFRKSCFFTLVVELCTTETLPGDILNRLNDFDNVVLASKNAKDTVHGAFYHSMYSGTNDRKARVIRSEAFRKFILG